MEVKGWVESISVATVPIVIIGMLALLVKQGKGIGPRIIQFVGVCFAFPAILILALEGKIAQESLGFVLGTIMGYVLSGISKEEPPKP